MWWRSSPRPEVLFELDTAQDVDLNDLQRMGRRRFVETMGALGASTTTLNYLSQEDLTALTSDPEKEMPYTAYLKTTSKEPGEPPQREPVHRTIPREEWGRRHCTIDGRERIANKLEGFTETDLVRPVFTADEGSHIGFSVKVLYETTSSADGTRAPEKSVEEVEEHLPDNVTGRAAKGQYEVEHSDIPVFVTEISSKDVGFQKDVPGGVWTEPSLCDENGTLCATFHDNDSGGDGWITAAHVAKCGSHHEDMEHDDGDVIGSVTDVYYDDIDRDCAFVDADTYEVPASYISNTSYDGYEYPIGGIITNSTLENNCGDSSYDLHTGGFTTERLSGNITDMGTGNSAVFTDHGVKAGDSGGPLFRVESLTSGKTAFIAGVIIESTSQGGAKSTTAETVEGLLDGQFY